MADVQMMNYTVSEVSPLLLVTDDDALTLLLTLEATELALPLRVVRELLPDDVVEEQAVIVDLDARGGMHAALSGDADIFAAICHSAATLPTVLSARVPHLLERPFSTRELRLLLSQLRYGEVALMLGGMAETAPRPVNRTILMEDDGTVRVGETLVTLTPKESLLLRCLLAHRGEIVTRQMLADCLHTEGKESDSNKTEVYLCYLRRKLEKPVGKRLISTVRGLGYRLEWDEI